MKQLVALLLCLAVPALTFAADSGYKVAYDGGSIPGVKPGNDLRIEIGPQLRIRRNKEELASIPATAITEISYGQDVHRRVGAAVALGLFTLGAGALLALAKSKKHFIGLTWDDAGKKGGMAFQVDKNEYRGVLTGLEGVTGRKAVDSTAMSVKN